MSDPPECLHTYVVRYSSSLHPCLTSHRSMFSVHEFSDASTTSIDMEAELKQISSSLDQAAVKEHMYEELKLF